jgi:hypothetical protein
MKGLIEHLALLNTVEYYLKVSESVSIKGNELLDASETKGMVHIRFNCPDKSCPEFSYGVEYHLTKEFFEKNIKKMLKVNYE